MSAYVFVDWQVREIARLIPNEAPDANVVILDPERDGIIQMAEALAPAREVDSIHVFSPGSSGTLYLGSTVLAESNLGVYESELARIAASVAPHGDILLYATDMAAGNAGQQFIKALARNMNVNVQHRLTYKAG